MPPTEQQLRNRELAASNLAAGLPQNQGTITSSSLSSQNNNIQLPTAPPPTDRRGSVDSSLQGILDNFNQSAPEESQSSEIQNRIFESLNKLGTQTQRKQELEAEAGLPEQDKELQSVINQLQGLSKEASAIPLQIQQESTGRGRTAGGVAPIQTARLRENTIKSLGLAAIGQTLQGNISLARSSIQSALDAEFEPEETKLKLLNQAYLFNRDTLERIDKKRADNLNIVLGERERLLANQKADREGIYNIGLTAQKFGAPTDVVRRAFEAGSREDALAEVGQYIRDPQAKIDLQNAMLGTELTKIRIAKESAELNIFRKYGGLTPAQHQAELEAAEKARTASSDAIDQSKEDGILLNTSINQIGAILDSSALDTVVGPSLFSRGLGRQQGKTSTALRFLAGGFVTAGAIDEFSGKADDTVALIQQILDQQFLDKLIAVKSKGATFGALSDNEGNALRKAANAIAGTSFTNSEDRVIGYDMSEKEFKAQMSIVQATMQRAYEKATGNAFTSDEQAAFDRIDEVNSQLEFNPAF